MLLRFKVGNHLSIAAPQELSLVASKLKGNESGLRNIPGTSGLKAVPAALIYGANASGKTNFIKALNFMRGAILHSHRAENPKGGVPRVPFALDDESEANPSFFEAEFVVGACRYIFGYTCNNEIFLSEWLYAFPEGRQRKLYEREGQAVEFGSTMQGAKKSLVEFMRENSLFISTATQNHHEELSKITVFFYDLIYSNTLVVTPREVARTFSSEQINPLAIRFLLNVGTGVVGLKPKEKDLIDQPELFDAKTDINISKSTFDIMKMIRSKINYKEEIQLLHQGFSKQYALPLNQESAGTLRLLLMLDAVFRALDKGSLVIIDELDTSLHTLIAEQVLELFTNPEYNPKGSQLIATTHDTNILSSKHLRRDQIWFSEKDEAGASSIFSLADFKLRETDRFEKGYLDGRFGAIPFSGDLGALLESKTP